MATTDTLESQWAK